MDQGVSDTMEEAFRRGELQAIVHQHDREIRKLDDHLQATTEVLQGIRQDTSAALENIRLQIARVMIAVPVVVVMSNALVALGMYELTRR